MDSCPVDKLEPAIVDQLGDSNADVVEEGGEWHPTGTNFPSPETSLQSRPILQY